ncbi:MAG TPA: ATP-dependent DNA helicase, partial [Acidobacteriota bacterium]|nr:ATP-dependent DNA helicase [Acidobacteriota bacterium]
MNLNPEYVLGRKGPLSKKLRYFEYRPSQIEYARAIADALNQKKIAILEAQTGTGKTLAYLLPALQTGKRVIISTGTKALQEQLYYKDIPLIVNKLGLEFPHVLMKGRTNYLCLLKFERVQIQPMLPSKESVGHFQEIQDWAASTVTGDIAEANVPEQAEIWRQLTISSEACLGAKCRFYNDCYVTKLKQRAEQSRIIVVNHHLFFADLSLQILSSTSILPSYDLVIFDEAHHIAEVATHNLSIVFSQRIFAELYQDLLRELQMLRVREKQNVDGLQDRARKLGESIAGLFDKFRSLPQRVRYDNRGISRIVENHPTAVNAIFATLLEDFLKFV